MRMYGVDNNAAFIHILAFIIQFILLGIKTLNKWGGNHIIAQSS